MFPYCCLLVIFDFSNMIHNLHHFTMFSFQDTSLVGQNGLEPSTSRLSVVCSSQLSYWPIHWWRLAGSLFCGKATAVATVRRTVAKSRLSIPFAQVLSDSFVYKPSRNFLKWWRLAGSNRWPPACKAGALPAELNPHICEAINFRL